MDEVIVDKPWRAKELDETLSTCIELVEKGYVTKVDGKYALTEKMKKRFVIRNLDGEYFAGRIGGEASWSSILKHAEIFGSFETAMVILSVNRFAATVVDYKKCEGENAKKRFVIRAFGTTYFGGKIEGESTWTSVLEDAEVFNSFETASVILATNEFSANAEVVEFEQCEEDEERKGVWRINKFMAQTGKSPNLE